MKSTQLTHITMLFLLVSALSGCKKDIQEWFKSLYKNKSYVECNINGKYARGEGLRELFDPPGETYMDYSYGDDSSFTFNIEKYVVDKDGEGYKIRISVSQKTLPRLGERYYFKNQIYNDSLYEFEDKCYMASVEVTPYLYECSDTTLIPKNLRKGHIILITDIVQKGYIEFTRIDIDEAIIAGLFEFEAEVTSRNVPQASYKASVTKGRFEGINMERVRKFYITVLFDTVWIKD